MCKNIGKWAQGFLTHGTTDPGLYPNPYPKPLPWLTHVQQYLGACSPTLSPKPYKRTWLTHGPVHFILAVTITLRGCEAG